jgi:parallel beta-helix repeat protein
MLERLDGKPRSTPGANLGPKIVPGLKLNTKRMSRRNNLLAAEGMSMKSRKASPRKRAFFLTLILSLALILGFAHESSATTYYVDDCSGTGDGTQTNPFCTIQQGIDATDATVVQVAAGTYNEGITMKEGVDVVSASGAADTSITGSSGEPGKAAVVVFSSASAGWTSGSTLSGFTIDHAGVGAGAGIFVEGVDADYNPEKVIATIYNCKLTGNQGGAGIRLNGLVDATIQSCTIAANGKAGIVTRAAAQPDLLLSGSTVEILGNTIGVSGSGNKLGGIILNGADGANIQVTIGGSGADSNNISNNTKGSGAGGGTGGTGIRLWRINSVNIVNNTISNNDRAGIVLIDVTTGQIETNSIYNHYTQAGINIGGLSGVTIGPDNEIYDNRTGIAFYVNTNPSPGLGEIFAASSGIVTIGGDNWTNRNVIRSNTNAGIAVIDPLTSPASELIIQFNEIHTNTKAGIAFFNRCKVRIEDNEIKGHTFAAGIFTGDWSGIYPPDPDNPPSSVKFERENGPADLTIKRNKVYGNRAGMRLDHASGTITNNLVYGNSRAGIRFGGNSTDAAPFTSSWGITDITNNTAAYNGSDVNDPIQGIYEDRGGGIVYDDINAAHTNFSDPPQGTPPGSLVVKNNISAYNKKAGIRACFTNTPDAEERDYNLVYSNNGTGETDCGWPDSINMSCANKNFGGCGGKWNLPGPPKILPDGPNNNIADPQFLDVEYRLKPLFSPAIDAGDPDAFYNDNGSDDEADLPSLGTLRNDMGCYGGPEPMTWNLP